MISVLAPGRRDRSRPGFAIVAAVVLIAMTGFAFVALAGLVRHDIRRTAQARGECQLRQLLLAGERAAAASLDAPGQGVQNVALPAELSADGATLSFAPEDPAGDSLAVTVEATINGLRSSQRLTYERREGRWALVRAELSATSGAPSPAIVGKGQTGAE
jgi:hypothetical protein